MESLGFCAKGRAKEELIDNGAFAAPQFREAVMRKWGATEEEIKEAPAPEDILIVNHSGGLKSFGHPWEPAVAAKSTRYTNRFKEGFKKPSRQLKTVRLGLAHNQGGHPGRFQCAVIIVGVPPERL